MSQGFAKADFADPGWQDWTPVHSGGALVVGNGTEVARYTQIGTTVHFYYELTFGSTSSVGSVPEISLPVAAAATHDVGGNASMGMAWFKDNTSTDFAGRVAMYNTVDTMIAQIYNDSGARETISNVSSTVPFTWATGDVIFMEGTYEAATSALIGMGLNNDHGSLSGLTDDDHSAYPNYTEWADYTPTFGNVTIGNGTLVGRYTQIGGTVHVYGSLTFGSTSAVTGSATASIPITASSDYTAAIDAVGNSAFVESGGSRWTGLVTFNSGLATILLRLSLTSGSHQGEAVISASVPFTWGTGDVISWSLTYEAAAAI